MIFFITLISISIWIGKFCALSRFLRVLGYNGIVEEEVSKQLKEQQQQH